uniref:FAD-binding PCMH-type domain-containing protein n=1 Tax=Alexandrium monilatum TaxID=311494 RepID=A0A7S4T4W3_9DINO|eukprot:CAMPEP_0175521182 /NCGR_PEP_ID=MMETSP0096-20121207/16894_1 /TAXON_ID=311494 /ORGANISM="Alexandrium monilatum, Strain CCMP3105" /LENGTH=671 /DNA_ID=CAMNT_0016823625 /DNA_START=15 /DNA_END=2030 /DNA_ORIENTATION=-
MASKLAAGTLRGVVSSGHGRLPAITAGAGAARRAAATPTVEEVPSAGAKSGGYSLGALVAVGAVGVLGGVVLEKQDARVRQLARTSGFRACCETPMTEAQKNLAGKLAGIVGNGNVKKNADMKGSRLGRGTALCLVKPGSMKEAIEVLKACVAADVAVIPQGANTALTGASVPRNAECDRPTVVLNLRRLDKILPIGPDGQHVLCFAGAGIFDLQDKLKKDFNRDSHSVLGSIFLNPSVAAGVAFGSGGTQIRKGPVFTQRALWCRVLPNGEVELINTLGLKDGGDVLSFLESRTALSTDDVDPACKDPASFPEYYKTITQIDGKVARYNADTFGIDPNRSEGKVMILATIHDTWPIPQKAKTVWVSVKDLATAHALKREVCLSSPGTMARSCEYMNREIYEATDLGGRLCVKVIDLLGMRPIGYLWEVKRFVETLPIPFASIIPEKFMWWFNNLFPASLPKALRDLGDEFDHHMLIDFAEYSQGEVDALQALLDKFVASKPEGHVKYHVCGDPHTQTRANLFRFVMAIAFRVYCTGKGMQGLSIDYAMPKNFSEYPTLPGQYPIAKRCVYSHFGCNVYHEDLVFGPDVDVEEAKHVIKHAIEDVGGKLPAEHGHGTEYHAPATTQKRWMNMDPLNVMNPGVGGTAYNRNYASSPCHACACAHTGNLAAVH